MALSRNNLFTCFVPNCNGIHWAHVAGSEESFPIYFLGFHEDRDAAVVEHERFGGFGHAVAEADAQRPVDPHAEAADDAFVEIAHIPSNPSSARAVSITAGVISAMPRSLA